MCANIYQRNVSSHALSSVVEGGMHHLLQHCPKVTLQLIVIVKQKVCQAQYFYTRREGTVFFVCFHKIKLYRMHWKHVTVFIFKVTM